ncbi:LPP20 family lipoprotein [Kaarinaea lacus]
MAKWRFSPRLTPATILIAATFLSLFSACSSGPTKVESDLGLKGVPDWVNEGTSTLKTKDGRLFHGVGSAPMMDDMSFQTSMADNRARAEIARILTSYMEVVSRDYIATQSAQQQGYTQANASREISNISKVNLSGARIIGHWRDKKSGIIYSIAELDMKGVKETLDQVSAMNEGLKGYLHAEGDNIFDRIVEGGSN